MSLEQLEGGEEQDLLGEEEEVLKRYIVFDRFTSKSISLFNTMRPLSLSSAYLRTAFVSQFVFTLTLNRFAKQRGVGERCWTSERWHQILTIFNSNDFQ